jgi:hypothetical protein
MTIISVATQLVHHREMKTKTDQPTISTGIDSNYSREVAVKQAVFNQSQNGTTTEAPR